MSWNPREPGADEPADHEVAWVPPAYGQPPSYGQPPAIPYGQPPGYGYPPNYGRPPGYGQPPSYGYPPSSYDGQPEYGAEDDDDPNIPDDELQRAGRAVTPLRFAFLVALLVSGAVAAFSLFIARGSQSIAVTVASLAIFGLTATLIGFVLAGAGVRAARDGRVRRAVLGGFSGGLFVLAASGAVASAVIFSLLSRS